MPKSMMVCLGILGTTIWVITEVVLASYAAEGYLRSGPSLPVILIAVLAGAFIGFPILAYLVLKEMNSTDP